MLSPTSKIDSAWISILRDLLPESLLALGLRLSATCPPAQTAAEHTFFTTQSIMGLQTPSASFLLMAEMGLT